MQIICRTDMQIYLHLQIICRYTTISADTSDICRYKGSSADMAVICLLVYAYQHAILLHLYSDLCRYICRYGFLSADKVPICRYTAYLQIYADMEKFSRYLSAGISADSIGRLDYRSYSKLPRIVLRLRRSLIIKFAWEVIPFPGRNQTHGPGAIFLGTTLSCLSEWRRRQ